MPPPVRLVPASIAMIDAELDGRPARQLSVDVPVPSWQRRGVATHAGRMLVEMARDRGVKVVRAHTLPHHLPSIGVLRKVGFVSAEAREPEVLAFELRR
jgi:RimJ/RimL family protein N-acetyltransferase